MGTAFCEGIWYRIKENMVYHGVPNPCSKEGTWQQLPCRWLWPRMRAQSAVAGLKCAGGGHFAMVGLMGLKNFV